MRKIKKVERSFDDDVESHYNSDIGIAKEYVEGILERVMVEMGAIEDEGIVIVP